MSTVFVLDIDGREIPVTIKRNAQAKRLILKVRGVGGAVELTVPKRASERQARRFAEGQIGWIRGQLKDVTPLDYIKNGSVIRYRGEDVRLVYDASRRRGVSHEADQLVVGGPADLATSRLVRWLKADAKKALTEQSDKHAASLDVSYSRLSIGDMKTRWGSCSSSGTLRYNWRIIMAPADVLNYLAVHEVSHMREMNHSKAFWAHVEYLDPHWRFNRKWLKDNGAELLSLSV